METSARLGPESASKSPGPMFIFKLRCMGSRPASEAVIRFRAWQGVATVQNNHYGPIGKLEITNSPTLRPPQFLCGRRTFLSIQRAYGRRIPAVEQM